MSAVGGQQESHINIRGVYVRERASHPSPSRTGPAAERVSKNTAAESVKRPRQQRQQPSLSDVRHGATSSSSSSLDGGSPAYSDTLAEAIRMQMARDVKETGGVRDSTVQLIKFHHARPAQPCLVRSDEPYFRQHLERGDFGDVDSFAGSNQDSDSVTEILHDFMTTAIMMLEGRRIPQDMHSDQLMSAWTYVLRADAACFYIELMRGEVAWRQAEKITPAENPNLPPSTWDEINAHCL